MMMKGAKPPRAVLIAGPTASGKSALALALAERLGGTVVNADSMQVYRELRILTARPAPEEETCLPHRLYGTVGAAEPYSVARWLDDVGHALAESERAGSLPILVGGTGLYFEALTRGLAAIPPIPPELRDEVRAELAAEGPQALHLRLAAADPVMAARLDPTDPQRIARALEVIRATGRSLDRWQREPGTGPVLPLAESAALVLSPSRKTLYGAIDARFASMVKAGAAEEVRALGPLGLPATAPAMKALGVAPLRAYLAGQVSLSDAVAAGQTASRHYAKRQLTWFKGKFIAWKWYEEKYSERLASDILAFITEFG
jgi:tRNA dimethylallyltransferase